MHLLPSRIERAEEVVKVSREMKDNWYSKLFFQSLLVF